LEVLSAFVARDDVVLEVLALDADNVFSGFGAHGRTVLGRDFAKWPMPQQKAF
jgi:hypothetical protein